MGRLELTPVFDWNIKCIEVTAKNYRLREAPLSDVKLMVSSKDTPRRHQRKDGPR
jgi:hypothetical protein